MPEIGEHFYFVNKRYRVEHGYYKASNQEKDIIINNRVFQTKEECELYKKVNDTLIDRSQKFKQNHINWYIAYDYDDCELKFYCNYTFKTHDLFFKDKETIKSLIDELGENAIARYYLNIDVGVEF